MGKYLRDENIKNISLCNDKTSQINKLLTEIQNKWNTNIQTKIYDTANTQNDELQKFRNIILISYTIRFDGKGYRISDFQEFFEYYTNAVRIERVIFRLTNISDTETIEIAFDSYDDNRCQLLVTGDDKDWVDLVFIKIQDLLSKYGNQNYLIRNKLTAMCIQLFAVVIFILISLIASIRLSPHIVIPNAEIFLFIVFFLILSNLWTFLIGLVIKSINHIFPNITFRKRDRWAWLYQALVGSSLFAGTIFIITLLIKYLLSVFRSIIK